MAIDLSRLYNGTWDPNAPPIFNASDFQYNAGQPTTLNGGSGVGGASGIGQMWNSQTANQGGQSAGWTTPGNLAGRGTNWQINYGQPENTNPNGFNLAIKNSESTGQNYGYTRQGDYWVPNATGSGINMLTNDGHNNWVLPVAMVGAAYGAGAYGAAGAAGGSAGAGAADVAYVPGGGFSSGAGGALDAGVVAGQGAAEAGAAGAGTGLATSAPTGTGTPPSNPPPTTGGNGLLGNLKAGDLIQAGSLLGGLAGGGSGGQQGGGGGTSYSGAPMRSLADIMGPQQGMQGGQRPQFSMPAITDPRGLNSAQVWQQYGQGLFGQPQMSQPQPSQPPQSQPGMLGALSPAQFAPSGNGSKVPNVPMASQPGTADMEQSYGWGTQYYGQPGMGKGLLTQMPPVRRSMPTGY